MIQKLTHRLKLELATALCYFESKSEVERLIYHLKYGKQEQLGSYFGKLLVN
jgi:predicted amidophosphoribosyltransferase